MDYRTVKAWVPICFVAWSVWGLFLVWSAGGGRSAVVAALLLMFSAVFWFSAAIESVRADGYELEKFKAPDGVSRWRVGVRTKNSAPATTTRWMDEGTGR